MRRVIDQIKALVATPSVSSVDPALDQGNQAVTDLLANWLEYLGWEVEQQSLPGSPAKANLIANLGGDSPDGLVLAGHTDTVPFNPGRWSRDPFQPWEAGGKLHGLGTADMKSFFAVILAATQGLRSRDLAQPLWLLATADEECTMAGARALVAGGRPRARYVVVGEPTDMRPVRLHKGIAMQRFRVRGHSGHASDPTLGRSALEVMHALIGEIMAWRTELQQNHRDELFSVPVPTLNLGQIRGGDAPNRICGECELSIDLRPLPGMNLDQLRAELAQRLRTRVTGTGLELEIEDLYPGTPPLQTEASSPLVRLTSELTGQHPGTMAFSTEAPYYQQLGMTAVVMGPGRVQQAHQPDEHIELASLGPAIDVFKQLIKTLCIDMQSHSGAD